MFACVTMSSPESAQRAHPWSGPGVRPLPAGPPLQRRCGWASGRTSACGSDSQHFPCSKCRREESHNISLRFFDKHTFTLENVLRKWMPVKSKYACFFYFHPNQSCHALLSIKYHGIHLHTLRRTHTLGHQGVNVTFTHFIFVTAYMCVVEYSQPWQCAN